MFKVCRRFIILFLIISLTIVIASDKNYKHRIYFDQLTVDDGLSQNTVASILQDEKGFLWFGTQEGLNRYDGYKFKIYKHDPLNNESISENFIYTICEDNDGDIWIGTNGGGLNRFNRTTEKFIRYTNVINDSTSLSHNLVLSQYIDKNNTLWVGTYVGLNKFNNETGKFKRYYIDQNNIENNAIRAIYEDKLNNFWVGSYGGGLNRLDTDKNKWIRYLHDPENKTSLSDNKVTAILEDKFGILWIGTENGGLNKFNRENETFKRFTHNPLDFKSLSSNNINSIFEDESGIMWIGTIGGGLCTYDRENEEFIRYQNQIQNSHSISNNNILSIIEDDNSTIWLGTGGGGINKISLKKMEFFHYKMNPEAISGSNNNFVRAIEEDDNNNYWIGTAGYGLYLIDENLNIVNHFLSNPKNRNSLINNSISSILVDKRGLIWVGTSGGGLNKIQKLRNKTSQSYKFTEYLFNEYDITSIGSNYITKIIEDSNDNIWVGTLGGGLNKYNSNEDIFLRYTIDTSNPNSINSNHIFDICEDSTGIFWLGTWGGGLNKFDPKTDKFVSYNNDPGNYNSISHNKVTTIYDNNSMNLWLGTPYGLNRFNKSDGSVKRFYSKDGLPNDVIYDLLSDDKGNLWISTNNGLSQYNSKTNKFTNYSVKDGLQSSEFNGGAALKNHKGDLLFGGINGITIFSPDDKIFNDHIPSIVLTRFNRHRVDIDLKQSISEIDDISLSYKDNTFSFEFAALDFVDPDRNRYLYKLGGYDDDWIDPGKTRSASYTKVPPGEYVFRVKGSNNDGVWNEDGISVNIKIIPPFWKTAIFKIIAIILLSLLVYTVYKIRIRQIELKRKALQKQVEEKTKLANELKNALKKVEELKKQLENDNVYLQDEIRLVHNFENIITNNDKFKNILGKVEQVANTTATVLILGESGTGKELIARSIHNISNRKDRPLVKVNCAALPVNLIESELFGYEKGAFTGAITSKIGRFELANNGTILLDEIGDLSLEVQSKLLRVLQEGEFERLGSSKTIKVDVRVIAATNRNINKSIIDGIFREDLYYRLNVFPIIVPPLRDRKEDIPLLAQHFNEIFCNKIGKKILVISQNTIEMLINYNWPGNIRELENVIERSVILSSGDKLTLGNWFTDINSQIESSKNYVTKEKEKEHIITVLESTKWKVSGKGGAAELLGIKPTTLEYRMNKFGIKRPK